MKNIRILWVKEKIFRRNIIEQSLKNKKSKILADINNIQTKIKELRKYDKYGKDINDSSESIQNNLNNFDKNMQKEKDNSGHYDLHCLYKFSINCLYFINSLSFSLICKT